MMRATMRLQHHRGFTFADAEKLVPYVARLGISHLYASPITTARPGSMHGYDVIDAPEVSQNLPPRVFDSLFTANIRHISARSDSKFKTPIGRSPARRGRHNSD